MSIRELTSFTRKWGEGGQGLRQLECTQRLAAPKLVSLLGLRLGRQMGLSSYDSHFTEFSTLGPVLH